MEGKIELKEQPSQAILGLRSRTSIERIAEEIGKGYGALFGYLGELGEPPAGAPFALYYGEDFDPNDIDMELCVPTARVLEGKGDIDARELPGGLAVFTIHKGPYDQMTATYEKLDAWVKENGYKYAGPAREAYLNDPSQVDIADLLTEVSFPVAKS
jgi:effector-binding domain-containing protein